MVIEDNQYNLYLIQFLLEKSGFDVIGVKDGRQGVEAALRHLPQAILLDIQLPGIDGYAVAAELKRHPELNTVPIIAVTSYAMPGDRRRVLAAGASGYLEKPIDPETFAETIRGYLKS